MLASFLKRDLKNLIQRDASPNFQAQNGLLSLRSWWRSVRSLEVPEEFDLLSVDIDRNDYHVWEKITHYRPRVVVIEYNSGVPPSMSWVVPYEAKAFGLSSFGTGNGASLKALEELGAKKGYSLVGCELCGVNCFFVRNDLIADRFAVPYTAENHFEPPRLAQIVFPRCAPRIVGSSGDTMRNCFSRVPGTL